MNNILTRMQDGALRKNKENVENHILRLDKSV